MINQQPQQSTTIIEQSLPLQNISQQSALNKYFRKFQAKQASHEISQHYSHKILSNLDFLFAEGVLHIDHDSKLVQDLMDEVKIDYEELRQEELKAKKEFIERQLEYLKHQTNSPNSQQQISDGKSIVLSKQSHKQLVLKLKKERMEQDQKYTELLYMQEQKLREKQEMQKRKSQQKQQTELQNRRQSITKKLQTNRQKHEQFLKVQKESQEKMKELRNHKFMYQQIEEKYHNTIVLSNLQQKKRKLKEIRQYRSFNIGELKEHQQEYLQRRNLQQSRKSSIHDEYNYQPPAKPQKLVVILEQQRLERISKLEQKKKMIDQNLSRQQNFMSYLKQHFVPTIDPTKREEIQHRIQDNKVQRRQSVDLRTIGITYLQEAKRRRRHIKSDYKIQERPETERNEPTNIATITQKSQHRALTNYLTLERTNNQHYERHRRRNLSRIMKKQDLSDPEKIKQLSIEAEKITEAMQRKQKELKYKVDAKAKQDTVELLLSSIQAKISIIEMYK